MKLLDTTFLIHYWGGREAARDYLESHEESGDFVTTTLNLKELAVGRVLQGQFDPDKLQSTFGWVTVVPFDIDHAFRAGRLEADLRRADVAQDRLNAVLADLLIAAVALELDATVVTRNTDDFDLFDVETESY